MSIACPTPTKRKFKTQREAIRESISLSRGKGKPIRFYKCPCGSHYHMTSKPLKGKP